MMGSSDFPQVGNALKRKCDQDDGVGLRTAWDRNHSGRNVCNSRNMTLGRRHYTILVKKAPISGCDGEMKFDDCTL